MRTLLARTNERLGPTPRAPAAGVFPALREPLVHEPALLHWAGRRADVWTDGDVRWGCAIAPPRALDGHDAQDHAMLVVVAEEEGASPELLHVVALRIGDVLRQGVRDPLLSRFEGMLQIGVQGLVVPAELGGTLPCRVYTVVAHRSLLPQGRLARHLLPILVRGGEDTTAMIVPAAFWDPRWTEAWRGGFVSPSRARPPHAARAKFARRLNDTSFLAYQLMLGVLAWLVQGLVLLPILCGLLLVGVFAALFVVQPAAGPVVLMILGLGVAVPGIAAWAVLVWRRPSLTGVGLGGEPLPDDEAPDLWDLVREVESSLDVIPVDSIVLDRSFGISVVDRTAAAPLARTRVVLVLGLPLLISLSPMQLRALLYQALSDGTPGWRGVRRNFTRHQGWVQGWNAHATGGIERLVGRWMLAYGEVFHDLAGPMARRSIFRSDKLAAGHAGAQTLADGIIRSQVLEGWWQTRWGQQSFQGTEAKGPVPRPLARWRARGPELNPTMARLALTAALRSHHDNHHQPAAGERLRALRVRGRLVGDPPQVASAMLGPAIIRMIDLIDDQFALHFGEMWRSSGHATMRAHRRRDALASMPPSRRSLFQHLELVQLCQKLHEPYLAAQHGLEAASFFPRQPEAQLNAGLALLEVGDEQGLRCLRASVELDPGMAPTACAMAMRYLQDRDMHAEMEAWAELWNRARGSLSAEVVRDTPAIVVQALAATSSG